ncbi:MAG: 3-hydroxyisobutyrate dehydrogenase [Streptosporangiaceae bacterium]|jgi:3-hydroxyisobutyrate dehydrogenase/putative dehydrogenase|nr:3-hydroxyisobutyrate dehydrogenase [Streptosporangiaceae bacterium]
MRIGWLGLGAMGAPMAGCLARAGHSVVAYDIVPGRAAALAGDGVRAADSITGAVRDAEIAAIMVATPDQVDQVLFGPAGAAGSLAAGAVVVIMATVGPEVVAEVTTRLGRGGVTVVDAPVSGGVQRAAAGDLLIMVSGAQDAAGRVRPLLDALARSAPVVGPAPGDGQRMKLVNQLLCGVHIAAAAEALAFGESLGLDPGECWRVLRDGAAASFMFEDRGERMIAGEFREPRSALDIFVKDMGLVSAAAEHAGASAPLTAAARRLYEEGHGRGLGRLDDSALIEVLRQDRPERPWSRADDQAP